MLFKTKQKISKPLTKLFFHCIFAVQFLTFESMENITQTAVPEWDTLIKTAQDTNMVVKETNQLTRMLREEQRKEFTAMKEDQRQQKDDFRKEMNDITEAQESRIQRLRDYDQFLTRWREDSRRDMAEHRERMKEIDKRLDRISKMQVEDRMQQQENGRLQKETDRLQKETGRLQKETFAQMKETDKKIKELATRFSTTTGNIIEGLMSSSATEMFQRAGYDMHSKAKNVSRKSKNPNEGMEVDVILHNDTTAIAIEVKASCGKSDIDRFLQQMEKFKRLFPLYADKEVLVAIAAVNYENDADNYAHERGLIVVRTDSYNIFSVDACEKGKLLRF